MTGEISLESLEEKIIKLRKELDNALGKDINNLSSPEILGINSKIDKLLVSYMKLII